MSANEETKTSVLFTSGSYSQFPHPVSLPPVPHRYNGSLSGSVILKVHILHGLFSLASDTAVAPIERVHLLIQNQNEMLKSGSLSTPYKGMKDCFFRTIKQDGFISLWRGNSVNVLKVFGFEALGFAIGMNSWHNEANDKDDKFGDAKFVAAICSATLFQHPLDFARTRLATDVKVARRIPFSLDSAKRYLKMDAGTRKFTGIFDVYNKTLKLDGIMGLYRGYFLSYQGMLLWDRYKIKLLAQCGTEKRSTLLADIIPVFMLYSIPVAFYPMCCLSRRMMMQSGEATKYKTWLHAFHEIIKHEGCGSLYKGVTAGITVCCGRIFALTVLTKLSLTLVRKSE